MLRLLSGGLREVVVYKNQTRNIYFMEGNLLHAMCKLGYV